MKEELNILENRSRRSSVALKISCTFSLVLCEKCSSSKLHDILNNIEMFHKAATVFKAY